MNQYIYIYIYIGRLMVIPSLGRKPTLWGGSPPNLATKPLRHGQNVGMAINVGELGKAKKRGKNETTKKKQSLFYEGPLFGWGGSVGLGMHPSSSRTSLVPSP